MTTNIELPRELRDQLQDRELGILLTTFTEWAPLIANAHPHFFPEYTDHGTNHIESVFHSILNLMPPRTLEKLSSQAVMILCLSVLMHDSGMHIQPKGIQTLLKSNSTKYTSEIDSKTWSQEWQNYYQEVRRFDDHQLRAVFGQTDVIIHEVEPDDTSVYAIRLYGEFIRRHHPRLAHEIAVHGYPGPEKPILSLPQQLTEIERDLIGLTARSHGLSLRDTFPHLHQRHRQAWREPNGIPVVYLMVLLRLSDYLQFEKERAPQLLLKTKTLTSPLSLREWEMHNCIEYLSFDIEDPESIYVQTKPLNPETYNRLNNLLEGLQKELDSSWAVLGEVYGRFRNELGIRYRRILTNLYNPELIASLKYLTKEVSFHAHPELPKLLIGPLYGEDPTYGVRELLQNAVDAVMERDWIAKNNEKQNVSKEEEEEIKIELRRDTGSESGYCLVIIDKGIGMLPETLTNYFFSIGASFRTHPDWLTTFSDQGQVCVHKTGRFGIGILAAFLLGSEIEVHTRHITSDTGMKFQMHIDDHQVEIWKSKCEIGTSIKISLNRNTVHQMPKKPTDWLTWFRLDYPRVKVITDSSCQGWWRRRLTVEPREIWKNPEFKELKLPPYQHISWTITGEIEKWKGNDPKIKDWRTDKNPQLLVNGFVIPRGYSIISNYDLPYPKIRIYDGEAVVPLDLSRKGLQDDFLPFEEHLIKQIGLHILLSAMSVKFQEINGLYVQKNACLLKLHSIYHLPILIYGDHFLIGHNSMLNIAGFKEYYVINLPEEPKSKFSFNRPYCLQQAYNYNRIDKKETLKLFPEHQRSSSLIVPAESQKGEAWEIFKMNARKWEWAYKEFRSVDDSSNKRGYVYRELSNSALQRIRQLRSHSRWIRDVQPMKCTSYNDGLSAAVLEIFPNGLIPIKEELRQQKINEIKKRIGV